MNQTQIKHALARAEAIYKNRSAAITTKHTVAAKKLSPGDRLKALHEGRFEIQPNFDKAGYYKDHLTDYIIFLDEGDGSKDEDAIFAESQVLSEQYEKLKDTLILGDGSTALELLTAFANG